jgi:CMP/dCMP kinase
MPQIITISGTPGSGKSTIAKILGQKLKASRIYVGGIRRQLAKAKGMTLAELNHYALTHPETDVDIDKKIAAKARQLAPKKSVIVEGRTQFYFLPESYKIFIKVSVNEGAKRIWREIQSAKALKERNEATIRTLNDLKKSIKERMANDKKRYLQYYHFDFTKRSNYDLIIDTTRITAQQATTKILKNLKP